MAEVKTFAQLFAQEGMADNGIPRSDETKCGGGIDANFATVKNNLHDNLAC